MSAEDHVGRILEQWRRERPDLDRSPMGVIGRVHRIGAQLDVELRTVFAAAGLGDGEFDVLATLRRSGAPYALTPGEITAAAMVTSGAVSKRVDRLERAGLVVRERREDDGRGRSVSLTAEGLALIDRLVVEHVENEDRLLSGLTAVERDQLAALLTKWALALDL